MALTEYTLIPGKDYQDICDATRNKTGKTDLLKSSEVANEILSIQTGGGSSNDVPYVVQTSTTNRNDIYTNKSHTITRTIPKGVKIVGVYAGSWQGAPSGGAYPMINDMRPLSADDYTLIESNDNYDTVSYTFAALGSYSSAAKNTFVLMVQYVVTGMTITPRDDGLYDAVVTDPNDTTITFTPSGSFLGVKPMQNFKSISFADGVTTIPDYLCMGQPRLEIINWGGITTIGSGAFRLCPSLKGTFVIPTSVTKIPYAAFDRVGFDKVLFHDGITEIDGAAFGMGDDKILRNTEYDFSACTSIPTITGSNAFGYSNCGQVFKIPSALFSEWSTANYWSTWASEMVAV